MRENDYSMKREISNINANQKPIQREMPREAQKSWLEEASDLI